MLPLVSHPLAAFQNSLKAGQQCRALQYPLWHFVDNEKVYETFTGLVQLLKQKAWGHLGDAIS